MGNSWITYCCYPTAQPCRETLDKGSLFIKCLEPFNLWYHWRRLGARHTKKTHLFLFIPSVRFPLSTMKFLRMASSFITYTNILTCHKSRTTCPSAWPCLKQLSSPSFMWVFTPPLDWQVLLQVFCRLLLSILVLYGRLGSFSSQTIFPAVVPFLISIM